MLGQPRLQDPHRDGLVLELASLVLAGGHEPGRDVRDPHRRVGRVHRLPAGAARAVDVDPQLVGRDLDVLLVRLLEHRDHVERRERRVPALLRVERADANEPVDAALGGQQPVDVRAPHGEGRGLDARLFAVLDVVDLQRRTPPARPTACTSAGASRPSPATRCPRRRRSPWRSRRSRRRRPRGGPRARASRDRRRARRPRTRARPGVRRRSRPPGARPSPTASSIRAVSASTRSTSCFRRASFEVTCWARAWSSQSDGSAACCSSSASLRTFALDVKGTPWRQGRARAASRCVR